MISVIKISNVGSNTRVKRLGFLISILLLSCLLLSGCGKKNDNTKPDALVPLPGTNPATSNPTNPVTAPVVSTGRHLEDALPGNSLLKGNYSNAAFQAMDKNLKGTATFTVSSQKSYDYTINQTGNQNNNGVPQLNRQDSNVNPPAVPLTYQAHAGQDLNWGRFSITLINPPNINEPSHTFIFQYQINVSGITLSSTDQIALFKAVDPTPFSVDFLEVAYTTQNPTIQRFRIAPLNPYQVGGSLPTNESTFGSTWLHVVSQMITTQFRPIQH